MIAMTESEIKQAAVVLEELIQWARKATDSEGVHFPGLHKLNAAEDMARFLRMKAEGKI